MNKLRSTEALQFISQIKCDDLADVSFVLYHKVFGELPNKASMGHIRKEGVKDFISQRFKLADEDFHLTYVKKLTEQQLGLTDFIAVCSSEKIIFYYVDGSLIIYFPFDSPLEGIEDLMNNIESEYTTSVPEVSEINLLVNNNHYLDFESLPISKKELDLSLNYNDDLPAVHQIILSALNTTNSKGLVLLHGQPGTGKTTYLRSLLPQIKDKRIIYVGADMASRIGDPAFMKLLIGAQNSVLVIEDAEVLLVDRESKTWNNAISNLLNISDGLLSDCLNIQVICTFNTNLENIDKALMRKGRLIARYEFKTLDVVKSDALLKSLYGDQACASEQMTITDIYNWNDKDFALNKVSPKIGF